MLGLHLPELIGLVVVLLLVFGAKRLPEMGSNVARGIKEFKKGINDDDHEVVKQETLSPREIEASKSEVETSKSEIDAIELQLARKKAALAAQERATASDAE
jgi:twin arginine-targeting protein translocase, TatA/E family